MVSIAKGHTPLMFGVLTSRREGPTLSTVNALLEGGGDPYRADAEGLTIYDRSKCKDGPGWLRSPEDQAEFSAVCKRLNKYKDDEKERAILSTPLALWMNEVLPTHR